MKLKFSCLTIRVNFSLVKTGVALLLPVKKQAQHSQEKLTTGGGGKSKFFPIHMPIIATNRLKQTSEGQKHTFYTISSIISDNFFHPRTYRYAPNFQFQAQRYAPPSQKRSKNVKKSKTGVITPLKLTLVIASKKLKTYLVT